MTLTKTYADYLRTVARSDGPEAKYAREVLTANSKTWTNAIKQSNARINSARSNEDINAARFPTLFVTPKTHTTINSKPTPNGARAIARARTKRGTKP